MQNPRTPATMHNLATVLGEINATADLFTSYPQGCITKSDNQTTYAAPRVPLTPDDQGITPSTEKTYAMHVQVSQQVSPNNASHAEDRNLVRGQAPQFWAQLSFMDEGSDGQMPQDWSWDDIGAILRGG